MSLLERALDFWTFSDPNVLWVVAGSILLGLTSGVVGTFPFLKKRALIGDALAHAGLPGVTTAFLIFQEKSMPILLTGAVISCLLGYLAIDYLARYTKIKEDSALALILSVFFALGLFQLVQIQKLPIASQAGLDSFLFGKAAGLVGEDVKLLISIAIILLVFTFVFFRVLRHITFDPWHAKAIGMKVNFFEFLLALAVVLTVAIGMQLVGVVLMAAILLIPPSSARYWTNNLSKMLVLSGLFGATAGLFGAFISYLAPQMPTGPWIVIVCSFIFAISLIFSPTRGILSRSIKQKRFENNIDEENILRSLYLIANENWDSVRPIESSTVLRHRALALPRFEKACQRLENKGLVIRTLSNLILTKTGFEMAEKTTRLHRLWELYLTRFTEIELDHVHADADEIEHVLTKELAERLVAELEDNTVDPHGKTIPNKELAK